MSEHVWRRPLPTPQRATQAACFIEPSLGSGSRGRYAAERLRSTSVGPARHCFRGETRWGGGARVVALRHDVTLAVPLAQPHAVNALLVADARPPDCRANPLSLDGTSLGYFDHVAHEVSHAPSYRGQLRLLSQQVCSSPRSRRCAGAAGLVGTIACSLSREAVVLTGGTDAVCLHRSARREARLVAGSCRSRREERDLCFARYVDAASDGL
jgi:hypothetical protein